MKLWKNRTVLGILCIILSLLICFAVTPLFNAGLAKKATIVRFTKAVKAGEEIRRNMVAETEVGSYNLPEGVCRSIGQVEGKYLTMDVCAGDYILAGKVSDGPAAENRYLYSLTGERQAMSVTIGSFAEGLSGKLRTGDIVSVIAPDYLGRGEAVIPAGLKYVEVIAVTAKSGDDANTESVPEEEEEELPATVTLLVRPEQSRLLAQLEADGGMHLSLVFRGAAGEAGKFVKAQEEVLEAMEAERQGEDTDAGGGTEGEDNANGQTDGEKSVAEIMSEHDGRVSGGEE